MNIAEFGTFQDIILIVENYYGDKEFSEAINRNTSLSEDELEQIFDRIIILEQENQMKKIGFDLSLLNDRQALYRNIKTVYRIISPTKEQWGIIPSNIRGSVPYLSWFYIDIDRDQKVIEFSWVTTMKLFQKKGLMALLFNEVFEAYPEYKFILEAKTTDVVPFYEKLGFKVDDPSDLDNGDSIPMTYIQ